MATSKTIAALLGPTLIASAASIFLNLDAWPGMVDQARAAPHRRGLVANVQGIGSLFGP